MVQEQYAVRLAAQEKGRLRKMISANTGCEPRRSPGLASCVSAYAKVSEIAGMELTHLRIET